MREIASPLSGIRSPFGGRVDPYKVAGFRPALVLDFAGGYYRTGGALSDLGSAVTHTRASSATMRNSAGTLVTVGSNVLRDGRHVWNGSAWVNEGVLIEGEARTNVLTFPEDLSNAAWSKSAPVTIGTPVTRKGVSLDQIVSDGTAAFSNVSQSLGSVPDGGYVTFSGHIEAGTSTQTAIRIDSGGNNCTDTLTWAGGIPTVASAARSGLTHIRTELEDLADGLYRVLMTVQNNTGGPLTCAGDYYVQWAGPGAALDTYAGGFQGELAATASSYNGSGVARVADALSVGAPDLPYNAAGMSSFHKLTLNYEDTGTATEQTLFDWRADANNRITITLDTAGANTGKVTLAVVNGGSSVSVTSTTQVSPGGNVAARFAWRVSASEINIALNGTAATAVSNTAGVPNLSAASATLGGMAARALESAWPADIGDSGITGATA